MKEGNIIGIDLAKNVFHVCVMNEQGRVLRRKKLSREQLYSYVLQEKYGTVAMEACGGANYWARRFRESGFETRVIAAHFVKPFVKSNKNDEIDAEAICEAALRPQMRFVSVKSEEQQDLQSVHRVRERLVRSRTALANEIRGLLLEYGIVIRKGINFVRRCLPEVLEEQSETRSSEWRETFQGLWQEFQYLDKRIDSTERQLKAVACGNTSCQSLLKIPGVGILTATAVVAAAGDGKAFENGRQFAAWLGLTPGQYSTGGKQRLGSITKRGDKYIRKLFVQGARSVAVAAEGRRNNKDPLKRQVNATAEWLFEVAGRRGGNRAIVALANKTARRVWHVLAKNEDFKQPEVLLAEAA